MQIKTTLEASLEATLLKCQIITTLESPLEVSF